MPIFKYHNENNIISVETNEFPEIPTDGMGWFMFENMKKFKDRIAQYGVEENKSETYESLLSRCVRTAIEMRNRDIKQGDIISIFSYNQLDAIVPFIAAQFLGAIVASLDPIASMEESQLQLNQVRPKMIFFTPNVTERIEEIMDAIKLSAPTIIFGESEKHVPFGSFTSPKENEESFEAIKVDSAKTAVIFFSSGTTGLPKGIEVPHTVLLFNGILYPLIGYQYTISFNMASLYWISGVTCLLGMVHQGYARISCRGCSVEQFWNIIEKYQVTFVFLSTTFAMQIVKMGRPSNTKSRSLKGAIIGGSPISSDNLKSVGFALNETIVANCYGQTEVGGAISFKLNNPEDIELMNRKGNSTGLPLCGFKYKVVDVETNELVGPNKSGELRLQPIYQMNGYYNEDSSSAYDEDGWFCTGDVVYYDEDFCFYIVDRVKELIIFQSLNVTPAWIEGVILTHPDVLQTVVIGLPNEDDGDHPFAIIIKKQDSSVTAEEIVRFVEERVDDKHRLRGGVKFVDKVPYTPSGKVKRNIVKKMILESIRDNKN